METDQAPRVGRTFGCNAKHTRWRNSTRASVASSWGAVVEPATRPAALRGGLAQKIRCSVRSNAPRSARGMR